MLQSQGKMVGLPLRASAQRYLWCLSLYGSLVCILHLHVVFSNSFYFSFPFWVKFILLLLQYFVHSVHCNQLSICYGIVLKPQLACKKLIKIVFLFILSLACSSTWSDPPENVDLRKANKKVWLALPATVLERVPFLGCWILF